MKDRLLLLDPLLVAILLQLLVPEVALQADYLLVLLLQDLDQLACNKGSFYLLVSSVIFIAGHKKQNLSPSAERESI